MGGLTAAAEQQYSLRWNDFHSSILSSFRHLQDEGDFVDVTLACDGRSFSAHKVYFKSFMDSQCLFLESKTNY